MRALILCLGMLVLAVAPVLHAFEVQSQTPMVFSPESEVLVLADPDGTLGVEQARQRLSEFRPAADTAKPDARNTYWIAVRLNSQLDVARELRIDVPLWEEIYPFIIEGDGEAMPLRAAGAFRGARNVLVDSNPYTTPIADAQSQFALFQLRPGVPTTLLVRLQANRNSIPSTFVPTFSDYARQLEQRRFGMMIEGLMVGIQLTLCIFGWYSAIQNRDRTSVLYAIWIVFAILSTGALRVHDGSRLFEFLVDVEGLRPGLHPLTWNLTTALSYGQAIGYVLFARSFLDLKLHMPRVHLLTNAYIVWTLLHLTITNFIPHNLSSLVLWGPQAVVLLLVLSTIFVCAFQRYRQGQRVALFFMLAMIPYLFFRMLFILGTLLQMPSPFALLEPTGIALFMQNPSTAQAVGVCCEALIMGLAVFSKNRWLQEELKQKMQAQAELVETQNQRLEATVAERTRELLESKADTERQHQLVTDSIRYASRLQKAQLPRGQRLKGAVQSWQAIWEPRDTIGGDVWWVSPPDADGRLTVVLADSTGHGVPGAMLSVLISTSLERLFATRPDLDPASALLALDQALRIGLNQAVEGSESDDGCDAGILRIDPRRNEIEFAGAKLGLLHVRADGAVERIQPTRISLGYQQPPQQPPALEKRPVAPGDMLLMVTDGITDQIGGGADGAPRAYGFKRLVPLLEKYAGRGADVLTEAIRHDLQRWQGSQMRRDDATAVVLQMA
jgi:serine phosphatase RsbU (regulator of sigma subunit)